MLPATCRDQMSRRVALCLQACGHRLRRAQLGGIKVKCLTTPVAAATAFLFAFSATIVPLHAQDGEEPEFSADVPASILTPEDVESRIGTLKFFDGLPDAETVAKVYDNLDFIRGVESFLSGVLIASVHAICKGLEAVGVRKNGGVAITEQLVDARSLFLTPNTASPYVIHCLDLTLGPMVVEVPPSVLGPVNDAAFRFVTDLGMTGPDQGKGGKYLFVPPGYSGELPQEGYFLIPSRTNNLVGFYRTFVENGDIAATVRNVKEKAKVYPLSSAAEPPPTTFSNISGMRLNTIYPTDFSFYEGLNAAVQAEPSSAFDAEMAGQFASIGIRKGELFEPTERMKEILSDAAAVGNATARALLFAPRDPEAILYEDRQWRSALVGRSYEFLDVGARLLDARTAFHYYATGMSPSMAEAKPETGSAYAYAVRDARGEYLDGGKTYRITLPAPVPAAAFWSFTVYDSQTRSLLETDQRAAGIDSLSPALKANEDGSYTVWFGPQPPEGKEGNWVQTVPGKSWNAILRLYSPQQAWFDKSWKPGDFEVVD
jgi:hypothetical protein